MHLVGSTQECWFGQSPVTPVQLFLPLSLLSHPLQSLPVLLLLLLKMLPDLSDVIHGSPKVKLPTSLASLAMKVEVGSDLTA